MNWKAKGSRNERRSMRLLEAAGDTCTRAAASLGVFDIIGIGSNDFVVVQVKTRNWPGEVEMEDIRSFTCPPNCRKLVHRWRDFQREPDVKVVTG
jgi:Holliday junction resolvase